MNRQLHTLGSLHALPSAGFARLACASQAAHRGVLTRGPRALQGAIALDRLAPMWLMLSLLLATWPQLLWMARRMVDGSDDPLGVLALGTLLAVLVWQRRHLRQSPALGWLLAAMAWVGAAGLAQAYLPNLVAALCAMLGLACGTRALLPERVASGPLLVLAVLALPLLASLQYFMGYPLRVLVAEVTRWLMSATHEVSRSGAALQVDGQLVLVDAACSGVQLAWLGYFTACCLALMRGLGTARFVSRLPWVGLCVLAGNIVRNWVLVATQADGQPLATWLHEGIGLLTIGMVVMGLSAIIQPKQAAVRDTRHKQSPDQLWQRALMALPQVPNRFGLRVLIKAICLCAMPLFAVAQWGQLANEPQATARSNAAAEWPQQWQGQPLRPLALGPVEQRFADQFPGQLARLTNGQDVLVWRHVDRPTRMLHPAPDCYRALGYRVHGEHLAPLAPPTPLAQTNRITLTVRAATPKGLWRCFMAEKNGQRLRVCEQLQDASGQVFTDTSAWYWSASLGQSKGPWQSITVAQSQ